MHVNKINLSITLVYPVNKNKVVKKSRVRQMRDNGGR